MLAINSNQRIVYMCVFIPWDISLAKALARIDKGWSDHLPLRAFLGPTNSNLWGIQ